MGHVGRPEKKNSKPDHFSVNTEDVLECLLDALRPRQTLMFLRGESWLICRKHFNSISTFYFEKKGRNIKNCFIDFSIKPFIKWSRVLHNLIEIYAHNDNDKDCNWQCRNYSHMAVRVMAIDRWGCYRLATTNAGSVAKKVNRAANFQNVHYVPPCVCPLNYQNLT